MPVDSPLLREWDMLQSQVIPHLVSSGGGAYRPRVWSVGSVADAVAVTAAYRHVDGSRPIEAYVSQRAQIPSPLSFSLADIRCVPDAGRSSAFRRVSGTGWTAGAEVAEQVLLGVPTFPVDLVTLRVEEAADRLDSVIERLRDGGHLLLVGGDARAVGTRGLRAIDGSGRYFCKGARRGEHATSAARDGGKEAETLALFLARADLVLAHTRLARSLARRFSHHGESRDDLEQVALLALVKAARRFDPTREISFSTFATASILGEIKRHFRDKTWMMRVPRSVQEAYLSVKEARDVLTQELSASPTIAQVAQRVGVSEEAVLEAMEAGDNYWPESLDAGVFEGDAGRDIPVNDGGFERTLERQQFAALLPRLTHRERLILKRVYFDGWTQRQVADEVGVSQMQVSRLLTRTIEKLRAWADE